MDTSKRSYKLLSVCLIICIFQGTLAIPLESNPSPNGGLDNEEFPKLLIILIDGFRWDYIARQRHQLPFFTHFMTEGAHAKWIDPIFPSLSFPSWTTITTGLYPEEHNILGNYMLRKSSNVDDATPTNSNSSTTSHSESVFDLKGNSTGNPIWWQSSEQIWTTAKKQGRKVYLANWARCDVPYEGIVPNECSAYKYQDVNIKFRDAINIALKRLKSGFSLAMVYDDLIDHTGHHFGPDSNELRVAMVERDTVLREFLLNVQLAGLKHKLNIVITSDHGMTALSKNVTRVYLKDYIDESTVSRVVDYGPMVQIAANPEKKELLEEALKDLPGVKTYSKDELPEDFHFKKGKYVLDYILVAEPGHFIVGLDSDKQIPHDAKSSSFSPYQGVHGYNGTTMPDMRTVFLAKGPAFKRGWTNPPFGLVDQYQIFTKILKLEPRPNHGNWSSVAEMFN